MDFVRVLPWWLDVGTGHARLGLGGFASAVWCGGLQRGVHSCFAWSAAGTADNLSDPLYGFSAPPHRDVETLERRVAPVTSFDAMTGLLTAAGDESGPSADTIQIALVGGFVEVTINGVVHSSNPSSPAPDPALLGANSTSVTSIQSQGGEGNDSLTVLNGLNADGQITIDGGNGDDQIVGSSRRELLLGGAGNDSLDAGASNSNDTLEGGSGNDTLDGGPGSDTFRFIGSGLGDDTISEDVSEGIADLLDFNGFTPGGIALDLFTMNQQTVNAGNLRLTLSRVDIIEHVTGSPAGDTIDGNARLNSLVGGGGADTLSGGSSTSSDNDTLDGGAGADQLLGEAGNDSLLGGNGNDLLVGEFGRDTLVGGLGGDTLHGDLVGDPVFGDEDLIYGDDQVSMAGSGGADAVFAGGGPDTIYGGFASDTLRSENGEDMIFGEQGDDSLVGGGRKDTIKGGDGNDTIVGGPGADSLEGEDGNDMITANKGQDKLRGGNGADSLIAALDPDFVDDIDCGAGDGATDTVSADSVDMTTNCL